MLARCPNAIWCFLRFDVNFNRFLISTSDDIRALENRILLSWLDASNYKQPSLSPRRQLNPFNGWSLTALALGGKAHFNNSNHGHNTEYEDCTKEQKRYNS